MVRSKLAPGFFVKPKSVKLFLNIPDIRVISQYLKSIEYLLCSLRVTLGLVVLRALRAG